ncbi:hypothetical protein ACOME3_007530 [Neoechinorhynchus agilis]
MSTRQGRIGKIRMTTRPPPHEWDLSAEEKKVISERAAMRQTMKAKYEKLSTDPFQEGIVFDPAIQRYMSMKATRLDYYRPVPRNFLIPAIGIFCAVTFQLLFNRVKNRKEQQYRDGEVTYWERRHDSTHNSQGFL